MNIPIPNVALIFGKEATRKLFSHGSTFDNLVKELSTADQGFVFSTQANPNFLSFEHTVNIGKSFEISLSLIDPTQEFEKAFLNNNVLDLVAKTFPNYGANSYAFNADGTHLGSSLSRSIENLKNKATIDEKAFELKRATQRELFLAYGIGNNLKEWAGPFKVEVVNIDIKLDGARILTLKLASTDNHLDPKMRLGAYGEQITIDPQGVIVACIGRSNDIKIRDPKPYCISDYIQNKAIPQQVKQLVSSYSIDYHYLLVDTIRNYIQNATNNPNVIVLLPDINQICKKQIDLCDYNSRYSKTKQASNSLGSLAGGTAVSQVNAAYPASYRSLGATESFLNLFLGSFGLDLEYTDKDYNYAQNYVLTTQTQNYPWQYTVIDNSTNKINFVQTADDFYKRHKFNARLAESSTTGIPDHEIVISNIISRINEYSKGVYNIKYDVFVENNLQVLDLWKLDSELGCTNYPLFGGYHNMDPDKEVIIVGDISLISRFLYGSAINDKGLAKFLHPIDSAILTNKKYLEKINDINNIPSEAFGSPSFIPDEFAYIDTSSFFTKEERQMIQDLKLPVFRYNVENPNIFELNVKDSGQYFALLRGHFETIAYRKAAGVINGIIPNNIVNYPIDNAQAIAGYAVNAGYFNTGMSSQERDNVVKQIQGRLSDDFKNKLTAGSTPPLTIDTYIEGAILKILESLEAPTNLGLLYQLHQWIAADPASVVNDFINQLYNRAYQLNISTLPLFKLSNLANLAKPCVVLMQTTNIPQAMPLEQGLLSVLYSGIYRLMGYRHVINSTGCHSEFRLQKILEPKPQKETQPLSTSSVITVNNPTTTSSNKKIPQLDPDIFGQGLIVKVPQPVLTPDGTSYLLGYTPDQKRAAYIKSLPIDQRTAALARVTPPPLTRSLDAQGRIVSNLPPALQVPTVAPKGPQRYNRQPSDLPKP